MLIRVVQRLAATRGLGCQRQQRAVAVATSRWAPLHLFRRWSSKTAPERHIDTAHINPLSTGADSSHDGSRYSRAPLRAWQRDFQRLVASHASLTDGKSSTDPTASPSAPDPAAATAAPAATAADATATTTATATASAAAAPAPAPDPDPVALVEQRMRSVFYRRSRNLAEWHFALRCVPVYCTLQYLTDLIGLHERAQRRHSSTPLQLTAEAQAFASGDVDWDVPKPTIQTFHLTLSRTADLKCARTARAILGLAVRIGIPLDSVCLNRVLNAYAASNDLAGMRLWWSEMRSMHAAGLAPAPNIYAYHTLLRVYSHLGELEALFETWNQLVAAASASASAAASASAGASAKSSGAHPPTDAADPPLVIDSRVMYYMVHRALASGPAPSRALSSLSLPTFDANFSSFA
jgi:hypothetical protein